MFLYFVFLITNKWSVDIKLLQLDISFLLHSIHVFVTLIMKIVKVNDTTISSHLCHMLRVFLVLILENVFIRVFSVYLTCFYVFALFNTKFWWTSIWSLQFLFASHRNCGLCFLKSMSLKKCWNLPMMV